jgi:organic radical activating enzyme
LKDLGLTTFLETSGSEKLSGQWDWICLSPKINAPALPDLFPLAHELKVIIETEDDLERAENYSEMVDGRCLLFLQPEWSCRKVITPLIVDYIGSHPQWKLSLQMHKYIGIP